jgi:hypothetical protein
VNQVVPAVYECLDGGSGVMTCAGPVSNGANIDTASVGTKTFAVNATDTAGNVAALSVTYTVANSFEVCLLYDPTRAAKSGSTLPIKIQLCGPSGANLSSQAVAVTALSVRRVSDATTSQVLDAGNANPDSNFRFDPTLSGGGYIFNLSTRGLSPGTYALTFVAAGDPIVHEIPFVVR